MKVLSLFSGIGGFDLAFRNLGHEIIGACEIDDYARRVYGRQFPRVTIHNDASTLSPDTLPQFDVLCAGFPCQAFSIAGKRRGFKDTRGSLFFEIARIAKEKRPRYLLLENVKGLLSHDKGETFRTIIRTLDEVGYDAEWQLLNSKYHVPQNRERLFIIGHLRGQRTRQIFPLGDYDQKTNRKINYLINSKHQPGRVIGTDSISSTLQTSDTGLYMIGNGVRIRRLTPVECERLQGFPDNWTKYGVEGDEISDTQRYKMCGNAVTVDVIEYIAKNLK